MADLIEFDFSPEQFSGTARIFPLPNLVLFPHVIQPLHIFERRYCLMLEDALRSDQLVAMGLLEPGWENDYEGCPPIAPTLCLGRVVSVSQQPDGLYNILLAGLRRARLLRELPSENSFRRGEVELLDDLYRPGGADERARLRRHLLECYLHWLPQGKATVEHVEQLRVSQITLGALIDILAFTMPIDIKIKRELLEELDIDRRARRLIRFLTPQEDVYLSDANFPPPFSLN